MFSNRQVKINKASGEKYSPTGFIYLGVLNNHQGH